MTNLSTLQRIVPKRRKRVGRGEGSHRGKNSGLGHKGQNKHGGGVRIAFEGNQNPLVKRTPKLKGFKRWQGNLRNKEEITLSRISQLYKDGEVVSVASLVEKNIFDSRTKTVRVIASGSLDKKVAFSLEDGIYLTKGVKSMLKL